jgi:UDP-glucose 4-epimerase
MIWKKGSTRLSSSANNTLLITGASGFIGLHLIPKLKERGYKAILTDKVRLKNNNLLGSSGLNFIQCDITQPTELKKIKKIKGRIDLLHMAAFVPHIPSLEEKFIENMIEVNIKGTIELLKSLQDKLNNVYYVSTLEVYGIPIYLPIDEEHPTNPVSWYGLSKLYAEHCIRIFCIKNHIPFTILRLSTVYGPGEEYERAIPNFIKSAIKNKPLNIYGDGLDIRDYIYVGDVVEAIFSVFKWSKIGGIFNIAGGIGYSIRDIAKIIIRLCNSNSKIKFLKREKKFYNITLSIAKAKEKLKFIPKTDIRNALLEEIRWFKRTANEYIY